jgi:hypothetical protein
MLRPVAQPPQPPSPSNLGACAPVRRARTSSRVLLPPKRLGSAALRHQNRPKSIPSETPVFPAACASVPSGRRRVLDFACPGNRCQSPFSARPPRFAQPRGLAPPTSPESPPRLAARPGFAPPLGFMSPSKVILPSTRSGSRRGLASLRGRRFPRLRGVNGQPTQGGPRVPWDRKLPSHPAETWTYAHLLCTGVSLRTLRGWISRSHSGSLRTQPPPERDDQSPGRLRVRSRGPS